MQNSTEVNAVRIWSQDLAICSQTVVQQFPYVCRSYDINTTSFAIHKTPRTYDWPKYERKSATYYVVRLSLPAILLTVTV